MKITTRFIYGLKFLEYLYNKNIPVKMADVSENLKISKKYLEKIVKQFTQNNVIKTHRGPQGGYALTDNFKKLSVYDVYKILEGDVEEGKCYESTFCLTFHCSIKDFLDELNQNIINYMKQKNIESLFKGEKK